jgi:hypothetical protein
MGIYESVRRWSVNRRYLKVMLILATGLPTEGNTSKPLLSSLVVGEKTSFTDSAGEVHPGGGIFSSLTQAATISLGSCALIEELKDYSYRKLGPPLRSVRRLCSYQSRFAKPLHLKAWLADCHHVHCSFDVSFEHRVSQKVVPADPHRAKSKCEPRQYYRY